MPRSYVLIDAGEGDVNRDTINIDSNILCLCDYKVRPIENGVYGGSKSKVY